MDLSRWSAFAAIAVPSGHGVGRCRGLSDFRCGPTATGLSHSVEIISVEADWDDESGRTEVRAEIALNAGAGTNYWLNILSYSATVLAGS
jgi:hypothetical protein